MIGFKFGLSSGARRVNIAQEPQIAPFEISKFVAIGDSLEDGGFKWQAVRSMCSALAAALYGKTVTVEEQAVSGATVGDQAAYISTYIAAYAGQPNVVFSNGIGQNNVTAGTQFLNLNPTLQAQYIDQLNSVWDTINAAGHKMIQSGIQFVNYVGCLDNDNTVKITELNGTYTYTRDWLTPVVAARTPEYLRADGSMVIDQYEYTRGIYDYAHALPDTVHYNHGGYLMFAANMFLNVMEASVGRKRAKPVMKDFGVAAIDPSTDVDFIVGCYTLGSVCPSNPNINWVGTPYGNTIPAYFNVPTVVNTDGSTAVGVQVVLSGATNSYPISTKETGNRTATLENSALRSSSIGVSGSSASVCAYIKGLEPHALYTIEYASTRATDNEVYANSAAVTPDVTGTSTVESRADGYGQIFIRAVEVNAYDGVGMSGFRVRSANAPAPTPPAASPMDDTSLLVWFDASDPLTVVSSDGIAITWMDKTYNYNALASSNAAYRPAYGSRTLNGKKVLDFDGVNDSLVLPASLYSISAGNNTAYVVYASDNITVDQTLLSGRISSNGKWGISHAAGATDKIWAGNHSTGTSTSVSIGTPDTAGHVATVRRNGSLAYAGFDGVEGSGVAADNVTLNNGSVGASNSAGASPFDGAIAEIRIYNVSHDATRYAAEVAELKAKWGLV